MNGIISIEVKTRRISYSLELRHNVTVVQGDSGSGKSVLCDLISRKANRQGSRIDLITTRGYPCRHLTNEMCNDGLLGQLHNCIVFLDEDCDYIYSDEFAHRLLGSTNYFVLITRHVGRLSKLSFHVNALCKMVLRDGVNYLVRQHALADDKTFMCGDNFSPKDITTNPTTSSTSFFP